MVDFAATNVITQVTRMAEQTARAKGNFIRFRVLFRRRHQFLRSYRVGGRFNK